LFGSSQFLRRTIGPLGRQVGKVASVPQGVARGLGERLGLWPATHSHHSRTAGPISRFFLVARNTKTSGVPWASGEVSPFAPRKNATFAERKATLVSLPILRSVLGGRGRWSSGSSWSSTWQFSNLRHGWPVGPCVNRGRGPRSPGRCPWAGRIAAPSGAGPFSTSRTIAEYGASLNIREFSPSHGSEAKSDHPTACRGPISRLFLGV
jgi:hypothetical protein